MIGVRLEPVDTWFFRDGTPFSAGSSPQETVGSIFPPHPMTTVGALRAAIARCNGWNGRGRWSDQISTVLGDGYGSDDLGALVVDGPFLLRGSDPLFPVPRHLLGLNPSGKWIPDALARPGDNSTTCDLGNDVLLPEFPQTGGSAAKLKNGERQWLTRAGMASVLAGEVPKSEEIVANDELWSEEFRIGLKRDSNTRTAEEGMLYSTRHVRLKRGVSLGMRVDGIPLKGWTVPFGRMLPFGGENRLAECIEWDGEFEFSAPSEQAMASGKVTVIALSPLDIERDIYCGKKPLEELDGAEVVSACLDRPQRVGGWDSLKRSSLPLRSLLPPGSVLFCDGPKRGQDAGKAQFEIIRLGARQNWGFGLAAVGSWPKNWEMNA